MALDGLDLVNLITRAFSAATTPIIEILDIDVLAEQERLRRQSPDNGDVVQVKGIRKVYGSFLCCSRRPLNAVKGIWFGLKKGEVFGFLGTNGAGKTTTLGMLTGVHWATKGTATICGFPIKDQL